MQSVTLPAIDHNSREECGIQLERIKLLKIGQSMKDLPENLQHDSFKRRSLRRVCDGTPSEFVHPIENRVLTLRECARIQTFSDDFVFEGTEVQKALQIGNAIPSVIQNE